MQTEAASDSPALLERGLELAASSAGSRWATITVPAQDGDEASLLSVWPDEIAMAHGSVVGLGAAAELRLDRLDVKTAKRWAQKIFADFGGSLPEPPPVLCGMAFAPGSTGQGRWKAFPGFYAMLPRWTFARCASGATLSFTAPAESLRDATHRRQIARELVELSACLETVPEAQLARADVVRQMAPDRWEQLVRDALDAIRDGRFQKLVVARSALVYSKARWREAEVFAKLRAATECTPFVARFGKGTFLGATPERLIALRADGFKTEALAGTASTDLNGAEALLRDGKNLEEHRLVVSEIEQRLAPLCAELSIPSEPRLRSLKDVSHLHTPITGRVAPGVHILDLACALHPTPAIAGLPRSEAVEWISAHEPEPRGWYAGFVGWFDRAGDGDLSVAIRSGLLTGDEACLYTGAGIVAGSEPSTEYLETTWKQRPFLRALNLELPA